MIKPSEAVVLAELRKTTLAYLSDSDFKEVEKAIERDGILSLQGSIGTIVKSAVKKHGSHNQSSHGKGGGKGGGGGGSSDSGSSGSSVSVPENMSGDKKMDEAINALPKETRDAAYRMGFEMGAKARKDSLADPKSKTLDSLWSRSNNWIKDTKGAINQDGATLGDPWMTETVRAIGVINGILQP
jgi:hypothetical protein